MFHACHRTDGFCCVSILGSLYCLFSGAHRSQNTSALVCALLCLSTHAFCQSKLTVPAVPTFLGFCQFLNLARELVLQKFVLLYFPLYFKCWAKIQLFNFSLGGYLNAPFELRALGTCTL